MPARDFRKPPTIADVARLAGVSVPTVSRVLTGSLPVGEQRRASVLKAIQELEYRPNAAARALVNGRHLMIGVIASNTSRYGYAMTIEGIERAARAAGYMVVITAVQSSEPDVVDAAVELVMSNPLAGVIVLDFDEIGAAVLAAMPASVRHAATAATQVRGSAVPRVNLGEQRGAAEATEHLLSLGHRTVHHLALPSSSLKSGRTAGWASALRKAGITAPERIVSTWDSRSGLDEGRQLAADRNVTAVLCGNDELAVGLLKALREEGRDVPGDVSVIGFDDQPIASLWSPALTTVAQDFDALGARAFDLLLQQVTPSTERLPTTIPTTLVLRESTAPMRRGKR